MKVIAVGVMAGSDNESESEDETELSVSMLLIILRKGKEIDYRTSYATLSTGVQVRIFAVNSP